MNTMMKSATRLFLVAMILVLAFGALSFAQGQRYKSDKAWAFGVMGDTQWTPGVPSAQVDPEGVNPDCVAAGNARKLNDQFISHGVRFVFQLGDLTNWAGDAAMYSRADAAKPLLEKGIGFFPVRGNHETYGYAYGGVDPDRTMNIPAYLDAFPQTQGLANTFGAANFTHPDIDILKGLSYSFDYGKSGNNARFVLVDTEATAYIKTTPAAHPTYGPGAFYIVWTVYKHTEAVLAKNGSTIPAGTYFRIDSSGFPSVNFYGWDVTYPVADNLFYENWDSVGTEFYPGKQQSWISERLDVMDEDRPEHAFVLTHRGPMNQNHVDSMFGSSPGSKASDQNVFYASLQNNGVRYVLGAHDHLHNRALVKSPDGKSQIETLIASGASTKFYPPQDPSAFNGVYGDVKQRETQISQELFNIGYYIYTVDGPRVLVDYYSDSTGNFQDDLEFPYGDASVPEPLYTPNFNFVKRESWGYSLNGKQFVIPQGTPYTVVQDRFRGTTAKIIAGINSSTAVDGAPTEPRPFSKTVNTGWTPKPIEKNKYKLNSDILSLWGMSDFGTDATDVYVLSMNHDFRQAVHTGNAGIAALNSQGQWVNAVTLNIDGSSVAPAPIFGPYKSTYPLGSWGIDSKTKTAWAVLNYNADFAVADFFQKEPNKNKNAKKSMEKMALKSQKGRL